MAKRIPFYESKLIELLRTFQTRDFRRFREFLSSPYFNKREDLVEFYAHLLPLAPDFPPTQCTRQQVWTSFAPEQPFDPKTFNYLTNFLLKCAENYLVVEQGQQDQVGPGIHLLGHYIHHQLPKHFRSALVASRKALQAAPHRDSEWHLQAWRIAEAELQQFYASRTRKPDGTIERVMAHLDAFYLDRTFELGTELFALNQMFQGDFDTQFTRDLLDITDQHAELYPTVRIPRLIYKIHLFPDQTAHFNELLQLLPQVQQYYGPERVKGIFAYAQNHCIRQIRAGDLSYQSQLFQIYQESISSGVIYENGQLSPWDFKNVCSIALQLGEFDWVARFIEEQRHHIAEPFRPSAVAYNTGNLHFHQREFQLALRSLAQVEFSDVFYALDTRRLMLMIYYERFDSEGIASMVPAFRSYLKRIKTISESQRRGYRHFVDWVARLSRMTENELRMGRKAIGEEMAETQPLVARSWLEEQLER